MHSQEIRSTDDMFETSVFSTSPWNSDPIFSSDLSPFPGLDLRMLDLGFPPDSDNIDDGLGPSSYSTSPTHSNGSEEDNLWPGWKLDNHLTECSSSSNNNNASTTQLDELFLSVFSDDESVLENTDTSSLGCMSEFPYSATLDNGLSNDSSSDLFPSLPCSPLQQRKRCRTRDPLSNSISWSGMTSEEQLETVEAITRIISQQMGLREQLEVIKIIDPFAWISPTDTEFVIDLACLDDEKLRKIRDYVKKHATDSSTDSTRITKNRTSASTLSNGPSTACSNSSSNTSNSHAKSRTRRKLTEEEKRELKAWRQRQRKKQRQQQKESQSGLFACEEIISVSLPTRCEEEEIDIDILD